MTIKKINKIQAFEEKMIPCYSCKLPATLTFETQDCFSGAYYSEFQEILPLDYKLCNPATGPVNFENVEIGDVLEIHIDRIIVANTGCTMCVPNEGLLGEQIDKACVKIYDLSNKNVKIKDDFYCPIEPMIGVIGVAPKEGSYYTILPGDHGGNMDTKLIKEGSTLFLPVFQKGGLLALGDLHAAMGDGESFYTGLEVAGEVTLTIVVRKDLKIDIPFVLSNNELSSIATDVSVEKALKKAMDKMVHFLMDNGNINFYDAGFLCGLYGNLQISQVVDPTKTVRMSLKQEYIRKANIKL